MIFSAKLYDLGWLCKQELDDVCLKRLTEIAMNDKYNFPHSSSYRKPISLEEAVLGGSGTAQIVLMHAVKEKERKRLNALAKIAAQRRELDERTKKLERRS